MGKYTDLRTHTKYLFDENMKLQNVITQLELQLAERDKILQVNPYNELSLIDDRSVFSKDPSMLPPTVIDMRDVDRANKQLNQIYTLYNGHMQISLTSRDEILESKFYRNMMRELGQMRQQIERKDHEIEQLHSLLDEYVTKERLQKQKIEAERAAMR